MHAANRSPYGTASAGVCSMHAAIAWRRVSFRSIANGPEAQDTVESAIATASAPSTQPRMGREARSGSRTVGEGTRAR